MTPLRPEQKENIIIRLAFIESELSDIERFRSTDWMTFLRNKDIRRNIERIIENLANACIDICKIILAGEAAEIPTTYKEVIEKLGQLGLIPVELAGELAKLAGMRNILAHEYLDLEWEKVKKFLARGPEDVKVFLKAAQNLAS